MLKVTYSKAFAFIKSTDIHIWKKKFKAKAGAVHVLPQNGIQFIKYRYIVMSQKKCYYCNNDMNIHKYWQSIRVDGALSPWRGFPAARHATWHRGRGRSPQSRWCRASRRSRTGGPYHTPVFPVQPITDWFIACITIYIFMYRLEKNTPGTYSSACLSCHIGCACTFMIYRPPDYGTTIYTYICVQRDDIENNNFFSEH